MCVVGGVLGGGVCVCSECFVVGVAGGGLEVCVGCVCGPLFVVVCFWCVEHV